MSAGRIGEPQRARLSRLGILCGLAVGLMAGGFSLSAPAHAQVQSDQLGPATEPDLRLRQRDDRRLDRDVPAITVPDSAPSSPPTGSESVTFGLLTLTVRGSTIYSEAELREYYAPLLGTTVRLTDLYNVAAAIQARYREDGYFLTRVFVPAQRIESGAFELRVVEGYISKVEIDGEERGAHRLVRGYLEKAIAERPLRLKTLERYLLLANDNPGVVVSILLRKDPEATGAAILVAQVSRKTVGLRLSVDNQGSVFTGRDTVTAGARYQALTSAGDEIGITTIISNPFDGPGNGAVQLSGGLTMGLEGLRLRGLVTLGASRPSFTLSDADVTSESVFARVGLSYPFKRSRDLSIYGEAAVEWLNTDTNVLETPFSRDRIRVAALSGRIEWMDRLKGRGGAEIEVRRGLPVLNHTQEDDVLVSRADASGEFTTVRAGLSRRQDLSRSWSIQADVAGQMAFNDVLSGEEFTAGGRVFGRGYNQAEVSGDHGVGAALELRYSQLVDRNWLDAYQAFTFVDFGKAWERGAADEGALVSAGVGVRASAAETLFLEFLLSKPLSRDTIRGGDQGGGRGPQALVRVTGDF